MQSPPSGPPEAWQRDGDPLPDLSAVDVGLLRTTTNHPVLLAVITDLLNHQQPGRDTVAYYDDTTDDATRATHTREPR
ncbi:hypothetical protein [Streptomyces phaeochromogenes]|uniref:hypothetical protein n=1 Tax=Streptomyces phaeochromogenes TaxID=1923 RepID=UPI0038679AE3|nr:hypothetical protein OG277_41655 [Streptomyces phaeochromogenes]